MYIRASLSVCVYMHTRAGSALRGQMRIVMP